MELHCGRGRIIATLNIQSPLKMENLSKKYIINNSTNKVLAGNKQNTLFDLKFIFSWCNNLYEKNKDYNHGYQMSVF